MAARTLILDDLENLVEVVAKIFEESADHLNDLDTRLGDGDYGRSMSLGFNAMAAYARESSPSTVGQLLTDGGLQFNEAAGSTIGILMFSALRAAGKIVADKNEIGSSDARDMLDAAIQAIMKRGKSDVGQKTILDALHPAWKALEDGLASDSGGKELIASVSRAAEEGAEATRAMQPSVGRARWFAERSKDEIDPGAVSGAMLIRAVGDYLLEE